ncbi:MAG: hypothetical protein ACR2K4_07750 [Candidatus Limnocylindria bacterium]
MRGGQHLLAALIVGLSTACGLDAGPAECPGARSIVADMRIGPLVGQVVGDRASEYVFEPADAGDSNKAIYVLCIDGETVTASGVIRPIGSDTVAASATRTMASVGAVNGEVDVEWGYLLGRVNRDGIATLEAEWTDGDRSGDWRVAVGPGFFLAPVPPGGPLDATLAYRYLDADGVVIWSEIEGS